MKEIREKIGALLRIEREQKGISLDTLSEQLKISKSYLETIEKGEIEGLPSELYFTLFAKSYAEAMGIDYSRTHDAIEADVELAKTKKETKVKKEVTTDSESTAEDKKNNMILYVGGVVVAALVIFVIVSWIYSPRSSEADGSDSSGEQTFMSGEMVQAFDDYDWDKAEVAASDKIKLKLIPREGSWATIVADGDTVIYRTLKTDRIYRAEANYRLLISIGIPSAVDIELNGQKVNLRNPETRRVSQVEINRLNLNQFLGEEKTIVNQEAPNEL